MLYYISIVSFGILKRRIKMIFVVSCLMLTILPILLFILGVKIKYIFMLIGVMLAWVMILIVLGLIFKINYMG